MFPRNVFPDTAEANRQGQLVIGGCNTLDLAAQYGTPVYILDEDTLRARCRRFTEEFRRRHNSTSVLYASKAYINPSLARIFQEEGLGLDVVSGGELAVARAAGFPMERVYFHGNNKTSDELVEAVEQGIGRVVVDSFYELELLNQIAAAAGKVQDILVRVSPGIDPHSHVYTTTGILDSKFGFSIQTGHGAQAIRLALVSSNLKLRGLHFHLGSPIFELEPYRAATELVLRFGAGFREEGLQLEEFSPGGGFAIAYTREQLPPDVSEYAETIVSTMKSTCDSLGMAAPHLVVEQLISEHRADPEVAERLSRLSRGCLGWAINALSRQELLERWQAELVRIRETSEAGLEARFAYAAELAALFSKDRESARQLLYLWLRWWRDLLLIKEGAEEYIHNTDWLTPLRLQATGLTTAQVVGFVKRLLQTLEALDANANARLALETLMLNLPNT